MSSTTQKIFNEIKHASLQKVPSFLQFNQRIIRGYRVGYNFKQLLKSLFQWHNQTINTWTHLIGAVIIFSIIFSSNLFTQHYHSKHELLDIQDALENHQRNITENHFKATIYEQTQSSLTLEGVVTPFLQSLTAIERQINIIIKLTEEDGFVYRNQIIEHLKQFVNVKEHIEHYIARKIQQNQIITELGIQQLYAKIQSFRFDIHKFVTEIINLIQKLADNVNPIPKWPLLIFFFTASICLTFSFVFHLFHPHSECIPAIIIVLYKVLRKLDFSGVILLIVGSSFPLLIYGGSCVSYLANSYLFIMSFLGLAAFSLLVSGYFDPRNRQKKKSWLFGLFGVSFIIPVTHIVVLQYLEETQDSMAFSPFVIRVLGLGAMYLIGLFIYTVQCPQRYIQGKFDYCGASHQIWHLSVLIALYITYELNWDLYYQRRMNPCLC